jgi:deaminated glutathione amidase
MNVALCQMTSGADIAANLDVATRLMRESVANYHARLVCLPEYFAYIGPEETWKSVAQRETPRILAQMSGLAKEIGVYVCLGSVLEDVADSRKCANTSILLSPDGREIARYRKMRLFDVDLPGAKHTEGRYLIPGKAAVVCRIDDWTVGLSICFDVRFPLLYQELRRIGSELILVPSAFTEYTGKAHWEPILRARAIETQCYVAAAAQHGICPPAKTCHGHSMIVGPWGEVLSERGDGTGIISAALTKDYLREVRSRIAMGF